MLTIENLLDKEAILSLVQRYCRAADRRDYALMQSLYHDDAIEDHGSFFNGLAKDFLSQLPAIQAPMQILAHHITTCNIVFNKHNASQAEGEIYVLALHQVQTENGLIDVMISGRYLDRYEKRDGQWKFSFRTIVADWAKVNTPSQADNQHPMVAGAYQGQGDKSDASYRLLKLFAAL